MRRALVSAGFVALLVAGASTAVIAPVGAEDTQEYVVLYSTEASPAAARRAIQQAGGTLVRENTDVGVATVTSSNPQFALAAGTQAALQGAARSVPIGMAPPLTRAKGDDVERTREPGAQRAAEAPAAEAPGAEPLAGLQWDMAMIRATATESHAVQPGRRDVLVGILDTGVDGSHPDLAPNFNRALSRNFTTDIPLVDGPCEEEPDGSCSDPPMRTRTATAPMWRESSGRL